MRGAIRILLLAAAIFCFIVAILVNSSPQDWLAAGLALLSGSLLTDISDLDFSRPVRRETD